MDDPERADDRNRIGDQICLYCADISGFVYSDQTNSLDNGVFAFHNQDIACPYNIPSQQALSFCIHVQNRYRLNKRYRQLLDNPSDDPKYQEQLEEIKVSVLIPSLDDPIALICDSVKLCAEAEERDNRNEQKRMHGKPLKYGDVIQLRHVFSEKFVHVDLKKTSKHDKGKFGVFLHKYDCKAAQFRILPKYKVNVEGEYVRAEDQVVFESVQSPSRFLHASKPLTTFQGLVSPRSFSVLNHNHGDWLHNSVDAQDGTLSKNY
ncbi:hypothetical protein CAPTEDRAFT_215467 [Capitella teleta]|uniref:MIR domain-containing protein n=1 Tax=Capitella teleta TaxID=283909 RepID=R7TZS6_CAPTE|nr:hypothetical protein CAPTEDRAFT_215467 [Capitella teleta]|eukprot:ELT99132.1 hypothetical protein CAPTEDRAFT_215467 [Capitella teleta]